MRAPVLICLGSGLGTYFPYRFLLILFFHGDVKSRRATQRVVRRRLLLAREQDTVRALNSLAGFEDEAQWPVQVLNSAQRSALVHIHRAHVDRPPPDSHQSPQAALRQLLKIGAAYESPGQLASYVREKVSLPSGQEAAVELLSILPDRDRKILENFEEEMLLGPEERAAVLETGVEGLSHMDPLLANDAKRYHQFVSELYKSGLIGFTSILKVQLGAFFVMKKKESSVWFWMPGSVTSFSKSHQPHSWETWRLGVDLRLSRARSSLWHRRM